MTEGQKLNETSDRSPKMLSLDSYRAAVRLGGMSFAQVAPVIKCATL